MVYKAKAPLRSEELTARYHTARAAVANAKRWKKHSPAEIRILERDLAVARLLAAVEDSLRYALPPTPEQVREITSLVEAYAETEIQERRSA